MSCQFLKRAGKPDIAYHYTPPSEAGAGWPHLFFLGGFKSDMGGTKALYLEAQCQARGQGFLRFDYSGHGRSGGAFTDGTIGSWAQDALDIFDHIGADSVVLAGSSMGGWISLLLARQRAETIAAIVGIAAAPDFTVDMWHGRLSAAQRAAIEENGRVDLANPYDDAPYILTRALFEDGKNNLVLDRPQDFAKPMVLLQGMLDPDVPWETTNRIQSAYPDAEVDIVLIEDGDHRLSRPEDLALIDREICSLIQRDDRGAYL